MSLRVDLVPIIKEAEALLIAAEEKKRGPARDAAHNLLCALPRPSWADPEHGMTILYGPEQQIHPILEDLRFSALTWLKWLHTDEARTEWPPPAFLTMTILALEDFIPQNASVSANTAPVTS
jgi:hypothetical protein